MENIPQHSLVQTLRGIPDFSTLDDRTLLSIVGESMNLFWKAGSVIFEPGSPGDALYVVLEGEIAIYDDDRREIVHPRPGDFFGEMSLLMNATHTKTALALTDCEILVLPKGAFKQLLEGIPALAEHFQKVLESRRPRALSGPDL
jgi:CRP-like cAMP-binding protein